MTHYTHLIWDFNGTLLDDVRLGIDCVNTMLVARDLPHLPDADSYREAFGFPIEDYYRRLGFDFDREPYETVLAPEWIALYLAGEHTCPLMPDARTVIEAVAAHGIPQLILSASQHTQLTMQLTRLDIDTAFDEVLALDNIHARSKTHLAVAWKEAHPDAHPLFIGDTEHDAAVAATIGADCLLYTQGHRPRHHLCTCGVPVIDNLTDILNYLNI